GRGLVGLRVAYRAILGDGNLLRVRRYGDLRFQRVAVGRHKIAVAVEVKGPGAGVGQFTRRAPHLEEAFTLNDHIERVVGLREGSLGEEDLVRRGARAQPDLQARWDHGLLARRRPWLHHSLV